MRGLPFPGTPDDADTYDSPGGSPAPGAPAPGSAASAPQVQEPRAAGSKPPGSPASGSPAPAEQDVARARRVLAQHRRQRYPHGRSCGWCQEQYPCTPRRAAEVTLHAAGARRVKPTSVAAVPGLSSRQRRDRSTVAQAQMLLLNTHH